MAKRAVKVEDKPAVPARLEGVETGESARQRSGMIPEQWNAAIRLQCVVRDAIDRPVSLVEALNFAATVFKVNIGSGSGTMPVIADELQQMFDRARKLEQETKNAADDAARKNAGKRNA